MASALAGRRTDLQPAADPNVIPFIDVLLVLLIIFMVTAPKPTTDLRVDLPRPGPPIHAAIPPTIVTIQAQGAGYRLFVGAEEVSAAQLAEQTLRHVLSANPTLEAEDAFVDARVFVRADLDVAYESVVTVVETLQDARFQRVAIVAQQAD